MNEIPPRIQDRFDEIDRRLAAVEIDVKTRADGPMMASEIGLLRTSIRELKQEYAEEVRRAKDAAQAAVVTANNIANDVIRSGRMENLKLIGIVVGAFVTISGIVLTAILTGKI